MGAQGEASTSSSAVRGVAAQPRERRTIQRPAAACDKHITGSGRRARGAARPASSACPRRRGPKGYGGVKITAGAQPATTAATRGGQITATSGGRREEQRGQLAVPVRGPGGRVACGKRSRVRSSLLLGRFRLGVAVAGWWRGASTPSSPWGRSGIHKLLNSAARIP